MGADPVSHFLTEHLHERGGTSRRGNKDCPSHRVDVGCKFRCWEHSKTHLSCHAIQVALLSLPAPRCQESGGWGTFHSHLIDYDLTSLYSSKPLTPLHSTKDQLGWGWGDTDLPRATDLPWVSHPLPCQARERDQATLAPIILCSTVYSLRRNSPSVDFWFC